MTVESALVRPLKRAVSCATAMVRASSDDRAGAAALARLRMEATTRPDVAWLPPLVDGALPRGVHDVSVGAFLVQLGGTPRREELLRPFAARLDALARKGVKEVYVGGSLTTDSPFPHDIDVLIGARDVRALGVGGRLHDIAHGINWHAAERWHTSVNPSWAGMRPTWIEFFQHDRQLRPRGIARIMLEASA